MLGVMSPSGADHTSHDGEHVQDHADGHGGSRSHDHGHDHGGQTGAAARLRHLVRPHSHQATDQVDAVMEASAGGMQTLWITLGILGLTAVIQAVVTTLSGSVALLGDTLHNAADTLTALPLGVAFVLGRRPPNRRRAAVSMTWGAYLLSQNRRSWPGSQVKITTGPRVTRRTSRRPARRSLHWCTLKVVIAASNEPSANGRSSAEGVNDRGGFAGSWGPPRSSECVTLPDAAQGEDAGGAARAVGAPNLAGAARRGTRAG
jgi:hypothetical protein